MMQNFSKGMDYGSVSLRGLPATHFSKLNLTLQITTHLIIILVQHRTFEHLGIFCLFSWRELCIYFTNSSAKNKRKRGVILCFQSKRNALLECWPLWNLKKKNFDEQLESSLFMMILGTFPQAFRTIIASWIQEIFNKSQSFDYHNRVHSIERVLNRRVNNISPRKLFS